MKILTAIAACVVAFSAMAQGHLEITTTVQKEEEFVSDNGETKKRLVTADVVVPGETVFYTITFTNISDESADNVVITNPIADTDRAPRSSFLLTEARASARPRTCRSLKTTLRVLLKHVTTRTSVGSCKEIWRRVRRELRGLLPFWNEARPLASLWAIAGIAGF